MSAFQPKQALVKSSNGKGQQQSVQPKQTLVKVGYNPKSQPVTMNTVVHQQVATKQVVQQQSVVSGEPTARKKLLFACVPIG